MGQITEGSIDAQNIAKNLIEGIVFDALKTVNERTERKYESFESMKLHRFGKEEILICVKSEGMGIEEMQLQEHSDQASEHKKCYHSMEEVCSTLSTQGEGDFQPPQVRETKAFYHLESEGNDQACMDSSHSSVNTSFTDELINQLQTDFNNISFDNIHLSGSETEEELQTNKCDYEGELLSSQDREQTKMEVNWCCQSSSSTEFRKDMKVTNKEENRELRHSPKFSHLDGLLNQYFMLKENCEERKKEQEQKFLSTSNDELLYDKSKEADCVDSFSQTNPFRNPFYCSNVHSTLALSQNCCESIQCPLDDSKRTYDFAEVEENQVDNDWVEANEVQVKVTEPGCSKDHLLAEGLVDNLDAVQTRQYWSNVGLITEHIVDRRYMGPVEVPGIESINGIQRVKETYLTRDPEEIIFATEAESLEENPSLKSNNNIPKDKKVNYLLLPEKHEGKKKKKRLVSKLSKTISSIFKLNKKDSKE